MIGCPFDRFVQRIKDAAAIDDEAVEDRRSLRQAEQWRTWVAFVWTDQKIRRRGLVRIQFRRDFGNAGMDSQLLRAENGSTSLESEFFISRNDCNRISLEVFFVAVDLRRK